MLDIRCWRLMPKAAAPPAGEPWLVDRDIQAFFATPAIRDLQPPGRYGDSRSMTQPSLPWR